MTLLYPTIPYTTIFVVPVPNRIPKEKRGEQPFTRYQAATVGDRRHTVGLPLCLPYLTYLTYLTLLTLLTLHGNVRGFDTKQDPERDKHYEQPFTR